MHERLFTLVSWSSLCLFKSSFTRIWNFTTNWMIISTNVNWNSRTTTRLKDSNRLTKYHMFRERIWTPISWSVRCSGSVAIATPRYLPKAKGVAVFVWKTLAATTDPLMAEFTGNGSADVVSVTANWNLRKGEYWLVLDDSSVPFFRLKFSILSRSFCLPIG